MAASQKDTSHTGLLIMSLENEYKVDDHEVLEKFAWLVRVVESFCGYRSRCYRIREDPNRICQITGWSSIDAHYKDFHSSQIVTEALHEFGGFVDVRSNWHAQIAFQSLDMSSPTLTLTRCHVLNSRKAEFLEQIAPWQANVEKQSGIQLRAGWRYAGGWDDQDEFMVSLGDNQDRAASMHSHPDPDPEDTTEWDLILPQSHVDRWRQATSNADEVSMYKDLRTFLAHLEILHLGLIELPPVEHNRGFDDDDDDNNDDER